MQGQRTASSLGTLVGAPQPRLGFGGTARRDAWWGKPAVVFVVLSSFVVYATWAAFQNRNYWHGPYLSPFYSPELVGDSPHAWFGTKPQWWPGWLPFSPALLILWAPGLFRVTCYYYRGAYYKAFWADPPACTVGEPRKHYLGEATLPLIAQNSHRFFLYLALLFLVVLGYDVWKALWFTDPATGATRFGVGVGTLVLLTNLVMLTGYTFGCHSLRHLVGGGLDGFGKASARRQLWACATCFNQRHMLWAWMSLFAVAFADVYVRLCAQGVWHDWRII
jgi:hypothetical protein